MSNVNRVEILTKIHKIQKYIGHRLTYSISREDCINYHILLRKKYSFLSKKKRIRFLILLLKYLGYSP